MTAIAHTKRKRDTKDDLTSLEAQYDFVKRRRLRPLETSLAALSLAPPPTSSPAEQPTPPSLGAVSTQDRSPPSPEIQMKSSSWYEPEKDRIVILDLDTSDSGDDETPSNDPAAELIVSPAFLARLKKPPSSIINTPKDSAENSGKALALYRPPIWKPPSSPQSRTSSLPTDEHAPTGCVPMELDP